VKAGYAEFRRQAAESRVGFVIDRSEASALAVTDEERRASTRSAGAAGAWASARPTWTC
jgi:hypothetical protein